LSSSKVADTNLDETQRELDKIFDSGMIEKEFDAMEEKSHSTFEEKEQKNKSKV